MWIIGSRLISILSFDISIEWFCAVSRLKVNSKNEIFPHTYKLKNNFFYNNVRLTSTDKRTDLCDNYGGQVKYLKGYQDFG